MPSKKALLYLIAAAIALMGVSTAFARHNADVIRFDPATDGGKYLTLHQSSTMPQWSFNVGFFLDYAYEPLEFATTEGQRRRGVVDDLLTANAQAAIAFTDWMLLGFNMPFILWQTYYDPFVPVTEVTKQVNKGKMGDLRLEAKFRLLDIERYHVGLSLVPFMVFPTGASEYFLGNGMWSPGIILAFDADIKNRVFLALNAGYRMYNKTAYYYNDLNPNAVIDDTLILSAGMNVRLSDSWAVLGEVNSEGVISGLWANNPQNPAEFLLGIRYTAQSNPRGLAFTAAGGGGLTKGVGTPDYRIVLGMNYRRVPGEAPPPEEIVCCYMEEKIVITQAIHFEFDKWNIRPISYPVLNDVVAILMRNPQITLLRVEGHTDWIGSDEYNQKLSERRANSVRDYLIEHGIAPNRLVAVGYGEARPVADNRTVQGRARNRRTEFTVISTGEAPPPQAYVPPPQPQPPPLPQPQPAAKAPAAYGKYWTKEPEPQPAVTPPQPQPRPQPAVVPPPAGEIRTYTQSKGMIFFAPGADTLTDEAKKKLNETASYVKREKSVMGVSFQAFPAASDGEMGNSQLSWARANNAQSYFTGQVAGLGRPLDISSLGFANSTFGEGEDANKGKVVIWLLRKFEK